MSDHWKTIAELVNHLPLVAMVAPGQAKQFEFKDLVAVLVVGAMSAMFGSTMTVQKMEGEFRSFKESQAHDMRMLRENQDAILRLVNEEKELRRREREEAVTRFTRIETLREAQSGMGSRK